MDRQTMKIAGEELKKVNNLREIGTVVDEYGCTDME